MVTLAPLDQCFKSTYLAQSVPLSVRARSEVCWWRQRERQKEEEEGKKKEKEIPLMERTLSLESIDFLVHIASLLLFIIISRRAGNTCSDLDATRSTGRRNWGV